MTFSTDNDVDFKDNLRKRIRDVALSMSANQDYEASAEILCERINSLNAMSDVELAEIGISREDIGAHVIEHLRSFDA